MSTTTTSLRPRDADPTRRNVVLLATCLALSMSGQALLIATSPLAAMKLVDDKSLVTVPYALQWVATMIATVPASLMMRRFGRRAIFISGQFVGMVGGCLAAYAIYAASFPLFVLAAPFFGVNFAVWQYYRFAAADTASERFKSKAISYVLVGGVIAAVFGPELAKWTRDLFAPLLFAGGFLAISVLGAVAVALLAFIRIPPPGEHERRGGGRPMLEIASQPKFVVAVVAAMIGHGAMILVMTSTPLAMVGAGYPFNDAAFVIQWHILGMYAPSFFTGSIVARIGAPRVIACGALSILLCVVVNTAGETLYNFMIGLMLLGIGWNFLFVGGTSLLTEAYRPEEKAKAQGFNDFSVFGVVAIAAFLSGWAHFSFGWLTVNLSIVLPIAAVFAAAVWLHWHLRGAPA